MKKKTVCCSDLGAYINELLKSPIERLYKSNESLFECLQRRGD